MGIKLEINNPRLTTDRILNDKVGIFVAETCARYMNPYVPMRTGMLSQTYTTEPYKVTYEQPYAHYQYEGVDFNFNKEMHPKAQAHWDKPVQDNYTEVIAREVSEYIRRQ